MRKNLPYRVSLALAEAKQKLQNEIAELQAEIAEIDAFMAAEREEGQEREIAEKNVPRETPAAVPSTPPSNGAPFESEAYTALAIKNLPENFDTQGIMDACGVTKKQTHSLITTWTRRGWVERTSYGHYQKTAIFGSSSDTAHLQAESLPPILPNKVDQLKAKLLDLERQHEDCIDGSLQQQILADKIEQVQAELEQLGSANH